jgi:ABC-type branched-subunit amino acid transport system substrate-binding protein
LRSRYSGLVYQFECNYKIIAPSILNVVVLQAITLVKFIRLMGWSMCATIGSNSGFDQSATQSFNTAAKAVGISVVSNQMMITGQCTPGSLNKPMAALKATRTRIFGVFGIIEDARCILIAAQAAGLVGPGYFWFSTWAVMDPIVWQDFDGSVIQKYLDAFQNVLAPIPSPGNSSALDSFISSFQVCSYRFCYQLMTAQHTPLYLQNRSLSSVYSGATNMKPNILTELVYDAVHAFSFSWQQSIKVRDAGPKS